MVVEEPTEFDELDIPALEEAAKALEEQLEKAQLDRNYVQLERDTIQTFYDITKKEVRDCEQGIMLKDREMETMEENHRVEVRVYIQKVKPLEYVVSACCAARHRPRRPPLESSLAPELSNGRARFSSPAGTSTRTR